MTDSQRFEIRPGDMVVFGAVTDDPVLEYMHGWCSVFNTPVGRLGERRVVGRLSRRSPALVIARQAFVATWGGVDRTIDALYIMVPSSFGLGYVRTDSCRRFG